MDSGPDGAEEARAGARLGKLAVPALAWMSSRSALSRVDWTSLSRRKAIPSRQVAAAVAA
jgi:hypothetical protein